VSNSEGAILCAANNAGIINLIPVVPGGDQQVTKSACKPCGELSLHFVVVELIQPLLDCREKFDLLGNFLEGNFVGQLTNRVQDNFFLAHAREYARPSKNEASWKISGSN
jgi:hypothetical protein